MLEQIFFQGWGPVVRTAIGTTVTYFVLVLLLRLAGQRSLAKWYAFDLIVTVALGSTFANAVLASNVAVVQAVVGFIILLGLQFTISFIVLHWQGMKTVVNAPPTLVFYQGRFQSEGMRSQRVSEADVRAAVRQQGMSSLDGIGAVVLEADGTFSVIKDLAPNPSALSDIPELGGSSGRPANVAGDP